MRPALLALPLLLAACASPAAFQEEDAGGGRGSSFSRDGLYLGAYALKAYEDFDVDGTGVDSGDSDLGAGLRLGYRLAPRVAIEAMAENVEGFNVDDGNVDSDLDLLQYGLAAKVFLLTNRFQPYAVVGGGAASADIDRDFDLDDDGGFLRAGLGMDVYLTANFAIFAEANYNRMVGGVDDLDHVDAQAGIQFRF